MTAEQLRREIIMSFEDILQQFTKPTIENFPIHLCIKQDEREPDVYVSEVPFLCLVIDQRFSKTWNIAVLYPYICKESDSLTTFGWVNETHKEVFGNIVNSTLLWDEFVIGFQIYEDDGYSELWSNITKSIEDQWT